MAESGFNPNAGSPAGAQGIAQFMPWTAASYGLTNPYDPVAAIGAEDPPDVGPDPQFGSPELALAAYNAGPAPVEACHCIPASPDIQDLADPQHPDERRRGITLHSPLNPDAFRGYHRSDRCPAE